MDIHENARTTRKTRASGPRVGARRAVSLGGGLPVEHTFRATGASLASAR
jgi:hypothetical protein